VQVFTICGKLNEKAGYESKSLTVRTPKAYSINRTLVRVRINNCRVLRLIELPAKEPYPSTHLVSLFQETTGDMIKVVCAEPCVSALQATDRNTLITVELSARQIDLASLGAKIGGKAYKLRVIAISPVEVKG
jgi:hypothetical protein